MKNIAILGAGPAGLSSAYELAKISDNFENEYNVVIFEKSSEVGGISKTALNNGYYFDLGGHRFFTKIEDVSNMWNDILKDEFILRPRLSRIYYNKKFFNYPVKVFDAVSKLGLKEDFLIFMSFMKSQMLKRKEISFEDWVSNRFGYRLYSIFFKTYTEKVWATPCDKIQAEWASQRIKGLSIGAIIKRELLGDKNEVIKTLIDEFLYPKYGPGQMYSELAKTLTEKDVKIAYNSYISAITTKENKIVSIVDNNDNEFEIDELISSIPIDDMVRLLNPPNEVLDAITNLKFRSFIIVNLVFDNLVDLKDTWIYIHEPEVKLGRVQIFNNWSPHLVKNSNCSSIGAEFFCSENDELWVLPDNEIIKKAEEEIKKIDLIPDNFKITDAKVVRVPKAYPVYDEGYKNNLNIVIDYLNAFENLQLIGRAGMFKYNNMDHSIYTGFLAARNIAYGKKYDIWGVNQDQEYHEEIKSDKW
ncbi:NAD(P)/FAD-dependent oxidoreductase [Methanococcus maripaludis]|uniref:Protoporphyrinogen oxidase n=2 Tax=Methanococcus maripaludis TaxID=39152 RepID=A0A7J9PEW0_METMI|nr:NAD(P)/FAD-dependent oxidoreductase [Methanococcus maripaludis]MBA2861805.1 protoporphyrinogen oxidase [Methanococcus maripaludis]